MTSFPLSQCSPAQTTTINNVDKSVATTSTIISSDVPAPIKTGNTGLTIDSIGQDEMQDVAETRRVARSPFYYGYGFYPRYYYRPYYNPYSYYGESSIFSIFFQVTVRYCTRFKLIFILYFIYLFFRLWLPSFSTLLLVWLKDKFNRNN